MLIHAAGTTFLPEGTLDSVAVGDPVEVVHAPFDGHSEAMSIRVRGTHIGWVPARDASGYVARGWTRLTGQIDSFTHFEDRRVGVFVTVARHENTEPTPTPQGDALVASGVSNGWF